MKILQLRFKNLNSLVGEWVVDLTDPAYTNDGIFAITGPTGAGKSTLLDALCLALYGRTPRLDRVNNGGNEILSRRTGDCLAEVVFANARGELYRVSWSQHRARQQPDGALQRQRHRLARLGADVDADGELIADTVGTVPTQIEAITGMDFERFTRAMLLAQGEFAAFLRADANQRAPILEQITGTEIYSQISIEVHRRRRAEGERLDQLEAAIAHLRLLDPEAEAAIRQELAAAAEEEQGLRTMRDQTNAAITWLQGLNTLRQRLDNLSTQAEQMAEARTAFESERQRLARAERAASLDAIYARLDATRTQQRQDTEALTQAQQALPTQNAEANARAQTLAQAEQSSAQAQAAREARAPLITATRLLDQQIAQTRASHDAAQQQIAAVQRRSTDIQAELTSKQADDTRFCTQIEDINTFLRAHASDATLVTELAGIQARLDSLGQAEADQHNQQAALHSAVQAHQTAAQQLETRQVQREAAAHSLQQAGEAHVQARAQLEALLQGRLLREYRADKEGLLREKALIRHITSLEAERQHLIDGAPCPLCGATAHPFAEGNVPTPDAVDRQIQELDKLIDQAEAKEQRITTAQQAEQAASTALQQAEAQQAMAQAQLETARKTLMERQQALQSATQTAQTQRQILAAALQPLGVELTPASDLAALVTGLRQRADRWQAQEQAHRRLHQARGELAAHIAELQANLDAQQTRITELQAERMTAETALANQTETRRSQFGEEDPDAEERRLQQEIQAAEGRERAAREQYQTARAALQQTHTRIEALQQAINARAPALQAQEAEFAAGLAAEGFTDEPDYQRALLPAVERDHLAARARTLDEQWLQLQTSQQDTHEQYAQQQALALTDEPLAVLEARLGELQQSLTALNERSGALQQQLSNDAEARQQVAQQRSRIEAQQAVLRGWQALHQLIGSADGNAYRNFAQGLTFDIMIGHANRQLQRMSDRYLLLRSQKRPLELDVIDNYQAGEVRSTQNLSGGESFIISLALALGLSEMASQTIRVDSLFLDEGFGTLDDEALEMALETLGGLQQTGKLIGVISHVHALKERIATQIVVTPISGGRSRLSGPGCLQR